MQEQRDTIKMKPMRRAAQAISYVLHPFMIPLYMLLTLLFGETVYSYYPTSVKLYLGGVVLLFCWIIPGLSILILHHFRLLKDLRIEERRERILPLLIGAVCYMVCAMVFARIPSTFLIHKMMMGAALCTLLALLTTTRWKISLHLCAMGGATALMTIMAIAGMGRLLMPLVLIILSSGLLASSRLYLGHHNGLQILAGFAGGFLMMSLAVLFL